MKLDQFFGFLLILLAIYLGVNATARGDAGDGLFSGDDPLLTDDPPPDIEIDDDAGKLNGDDKDDKDDRKDGDGRRERSGNEGVVTRSDFCAAVGDSSRFDDLGGKHDEAVRCMEAAGVVEGVSGDTYAPRDALTRAQAATTIAAMIDASNRLERSGVDLRALPDAPDTRFTDVEPGSAEADAIAQLNEVGILEGYVDARFEPQGRVSRAQMASILDRTYKYMTGEAFPGGSDQFNDDGQSVHEDSINAVATAGIMNGAGGRFEPNHAVRRGPMATFAARTMIRLEETGRIRPLD
jgi:hypothetical protein